MYRLNRLLPITLCMLAPGAQFLLGCGQPTRDPAPTAKLEAARPTQTSIAPKSPAKVAKSATQIEAEIRSALPNVENYQELSTPGPAPWLAADGEVWLAANGTCRLVQVEASDNSIATSVELCRRKKGLTVTSCSYSFTLAQGALHSGPVSCDTTYNQIYRNGWSNNELPQTLSLQSSDATSQIYSNLLRLSVESERHIVKEQPCTKGSADKARQQVVKESPTLDPDQGLQRRFGVVGQSRRCHLKEGLRLSARADSDRGNYDRGALGQKEAAPVDCTSACPMSPDLARVKEMNSWFDGKRFNEKAAPKASISLHPSKALCMAVVGERIGSIPHSDCKAP
jgi:hypothetical protein